MTFTDSISTCFSKYATFNGTASRSEYWWFWLFCLAGALALGAVSTTVGTLFSLATLLPSLAAGARRLHDTDRSGWWLLVMFVPVIGWIALVVLLAQEGKATRYGVRTAPL